MSDDRENRVEGREKWISREVQSRRFDEAMARLGAEVAAHEVEEAPPCESCGKPSDGYSLDDVPLCAECAGDLAEVAKHEPVPFPLALGDLQGVVRSPITPAEAASLSGSGARFGDRLREWRAGDSDTRRLLAIADAIDQDAEELREVIGEHRDVSAGFEQQVSRIRRLAVAATHDCSLRADVLAATNDFHSPLNLRRQVDEAVERLRFSAWNSTADDFEQTKNILDVEPFLAELDRIFGERKEGPPKSKPAKGSRWFEIPGREGAKGLRVAVQLDGLTFLWPLDPDVHPGFALSGEAARDLEIILRAFLPGDIALLAEAVAALETLSPEDEQA